MADATRRYGENLKDLPKDHVERYAFACGLLLENSTVIDAACGCGYGSWMLGKKNKVTGIDIEQEALEYARKHYAGPTYIQSDLQGSGDLIADAVVSFETIEHLPFPEAFLARLKTKQLICSVPNEEHYPFDKEKFTGDKYPHQRHYTPIQFTGLLEASGFRVCNRYCQISKGKFNIRSGTTGSFLIYVCDDPRLS